MTKIKAESITMVEIDRLVPHPRNNNRHSIEQLKRLERIITVRGFRNPLTVSNRSGFVVCGHARLEAARNLGMKVLPVVYQDFESEAEEWQHLTADNELARWAELDLQSVYDTLEEMPELKDELDLLGIENFSLPKLNDSIDLSNKNQEIDTDNFGNDLEHTCPKCGFEFNE